MIFVAAMWQMLARCLQTGDVNFLAAAFSLYISIIAVMLLYIALHAVQLVLYIREFWLYLLYNNVVHSCVVLHTRYNTL